MVCVPGEREPDLPTKWAYLVWVAPPKRTCVLLQILLLIMSEKLIEELREHVAQLKEEVQDEKNKLKSAHNEKVCIRSAN